ncbi:MAG: hypothetical protein LBK55_02715 [Azoarcus sp.]|nr:hypothetical protein [Azoarcus sp.]
MKSLLFLLAISLSAEIAFACRCVELGVRRAYADADAVALLHIEAVSALPTGVSQARANVSRTWKTGLPTSVVVSTSDIDMCEYPLREGDDLLLYLKHDGKGLWETYKCWGNLPKARASKRIEWLDRYGKSTPVTGRHKAESPTGDNFP